DGAAGGLGSAMRCKVAAMSLPRPRGVEDAGAEAHELHLLRADQTGGSVCSVARRRGCS
ncbi:unnamed protein product, partial [Effrenium voratum]